MNPLGGCTLKSLDPQSCSSWLDWAISAGPPDAKDVDWLLAHCDDGVVWGRRNGDRWELSSSAFPEISPALAESNLQQLRLFGAKREILIWKADGGLQGRELADADTPMSDDDPLRPSEERLVLLGDRLDHRIPNPCRNDFSVVADGRGSRHAVPIRCHEGLFRRDGAPWWPLRLRVRHYFESDPRSGVVRIAASRLVQVFLEER
jgi:CRISPR-associated protein (TIGR03984 family)